ncbi:kelch-like protein 24 [Plakobranchus ocellatus]|uniref:Kelch-like protein 24 n=1 Tax=Plakobranchus ocellatus TaxID=259542 RepID=A0AAV3ZGC5_9GAST|nr:kelch-like protein 24 [Plakobranchus ocellatus]
MVYSERHSKSKDNRAHDISPSHTTQQDVAVNTTNQLERRRERRAETPDLGHTACNKSLIKFDNSCHGTP